MSPQDLAMQNSFGKTAMFGAAVVGNVEAMKMMVDKNDNLPNITDIYNQLPIQSAAYAGQKHAVHYRLEVTGKEYLESRRKTFVHSLLVGGFYASGNERSTHIYHPLNWKGPSTIIKILAISRILLRNLKKVIRQRQIGAQYFGNSLANFVNSATHHHVIFLHCISKRLVLQFQPMIST
ncbi:hypothetical protein R6Q59_014579 [Mikania micrantha]